MEIGRAALVNETKSLTRIADKVASARSACNLIVIEVNEAFELFNFTKKSPADYSRLKGRILRQQLKVDESRRKILEFEQAILNSEISLKTLRFSIWDFEGKRVHKDVVSGVKLGLAEIAEWSALLESVSDEMDLFLEEAAAEVNEA